MAAGKPRYRQSVTESLRLKRQTNRSLTPLSQSAVFRQASGERQVDRVILELRTVVEAHSGKHRGGWLDRSRRRTGTPTNLRLSRGRFIEASLL
jgi:hypothetical protein